MTDEQILENNRQQLAEEQQAEEFLENMEEDDDLTDEERLAIEDNLNGLEAGQTFAHRHIIDKVNTFIDVYRSKGYSEDFIEGFIDGINEITGGFISLTNDSSPVDKTE